MKMTSTSKLPNLLFFIIVSTIPSFQIKACFSSALKIEIPSSFNPPSSPSHQMEHYVYNNLFSKRSCIPKSHVYPKKHLAFMNFDHVSRIFVVKNEKSLTVITSIQSSSNSSTGNNNNKINRNSGTPGIFVSPDNSNIQREVSVKPFVSMEDIITISKHLAFCFIVSLVFSLYEGYDCAFLKPEPATIRQFPPDHTITRDMKQQFTVNNLGPSSSTTMIQDIIGLMKSGTRGMGRGEVDRLDGWFQATYYGGNYYYNNNEIYLDNTMKVEQQQEPQQQQEGVINPQLSLYNIDDANINALRNIQSYNEIMKYHRDSRVQRWKNDDKRFGSASPTSSITTSSQMKTNSVSQTDNDQSVDIRNAVGIIYEVIDKIQLLKVAANDYDWDLMKDVLQSNLFKHDLEVSCNILRSSVGYLDYDARQEIGFDWGSCAWRHCGAQADAQEALAELYNNMGLFEPFECLFTIDIVERSVRDILTVVPLKYHSKEDVKHLQPYQPYQSQNDINFEDSDSVAMDFSDLDFLKTLSDLRNE